jgi:hypothetical protein
VKNGGGWRQTHTDRLTEICPRNLIIKEKIKNACPDKPLLTITLDFAISVPTSGYQRGELPAPQQLPRLASRAVPHADKVRAGALERVSCERDLAGGAVEVEDGAVVRVLVGHDEPLAALVELQVASK